MSALPDDFAFNLVDACEANLLAAPRERFAQTGTAWVTRYALACRDADVREPLLLLEPLGHHIGRIMSLRLLSVLRQPEA